MSCVSSYSLLLRTSNSFNKMKWNMFMKFQLIALLLCDYTKYNNSKQYVWLSKGFIKYQKNHLKRRFENLVDPKLEMYHRLFFIRTNNTLGLLLTTVFICSHYLYFLLMSINNQFRKFIF